MPTLIAEDTLGTGGTWDTSAGSPTIQDAVPAPSGVGAGVNALLTKAIGEYVFWNVPDSGYTRLVFGVWVRVPAYPATDSRLFKIDAGPSEGWVTLRNNGEFSLQSNGTPTISSVFSTDVLGTDVWRWLQVMYDVSENPWQIRFRSHLGNVVSGTAAAAASNLNAGIFLLGNTVGGSAASYYFAHPKMGVAADDDDWWPEPPRIDIQNTAEGGTDETTISLANSGDGSGDPFTSLNIGAGNALVYDTARAAHGHKSIRVDLGNASGSVNQLGWTFPPQEEMWGYYYFYWTGTYAGGGSTIRVISFANGGAAVGRIVIGRDAQVIQVSDQNFAGAATSAAGFTFNAWYRLGWHVICSPTVGFMEAALYLGDSDTPITNGTCATDFARDTDTAMTNVVYGNTSNWSGPAFTHWVDDFNANNQGHMGPVIPGATYTDPAFVQMNRRG